MEIWRIGVLRYTLLYLAVFLIASPAAALPVVGLDFDSIAPGMQSGETFSLDIVISGVLALEPVNGFSFELGYLDLILDTLAIDAGGFLSGELIPLPEDLSAPSISYALGSFGAGDWGAGVLARIEFSALESGISILNLDTLELGQPFPAEGLLPFEYLGSAQVIVIPEPSSALLVALGVSLLAGRRSRGK